MPVSSNDLVFYLSGGANNGDPNLSLGGPISGTMISDPMKVFDNIHYNESFLGDVEYRCVYAKNNHATEMISDVVAYIIRSPLKDENGNIVADPSPEVLNIVFDPEGVGNGTTTGVASQVADENVSPKLKVPSGVSATGSASGTLAAGTYYYKVTARNANGETSPSQEVSATIDGVNQKGVKISWNAVAGATEYRVYGRSSGAQNQYWTVTAPTTTYTDSGTTGASGTPPTTNTAAIPFPANPPLDFENAIGHYNLNPGQTVALWIKRSIGAGTGVSGYTEPKIRFVFGG